MIRLAWLSRIVILAVALVASCATTLRLAAADAWYDALIIRSTLDPQVAPRPAQFQTQRVTGSKAVDVVSGGLKYQVSQTLTEWGPFLEWQRNTDGRAAQDLVRGGVNGDWQWHDIGPGGRSWSPLMLGQLAAKRDRLKGVSGGQLSIGVSAVLRGHGKDPRYGWLLGVLSETRFLAWRYRPQVAAELDAHRGGQSVSRVVIGVQSQCYPLPRPTGFDYDLQLTADALMRYGSRDEGSRVRRNHGKVDVGLNYFFVRQQREDEPNRAAGIGLTYSRGDDPSNALDFREVRAIALKLQF